MIIGRKNEIAILQSLLQEEESQFVAVYGRRRVGKTFLARTMRIYQKVYAYREEK